MAINFPNSPSVGQIYTYQSHSWQWNGTYWESYSVSGQFLPLSGGTVSGGTVFQSGLTANTISATTYFNLPVSGLTEGNGISIANNNGNFTITSTATTSNVVQGITGITGTSGISATTTDYGTTIINTAPNQTVTITGGTNIQIVSNYPNFGVNFTGGTSGGTVSGDYLSLSGGTVTGGTIFTNGLTGNTISATTYFNLPVSGITEGTGISITNNNGNFTITSTATTSNVIQGITGITGTSGVSASTTDYVTTIINTSPDQTVTISGGTGITTGGTYPNFTLVNSLPDQTIVITGGTNIQIVSNYPNFGVNFTGTTGASGDFLPLSGGTVTGGTIFTNGVTANTLTNINYILFNKTATTTHTEGQIHWNDDTKTLEIDTDKTGVTYETGQNTLVRVTNQTGAPLTAGTVVYINGVQGNRPTVTKATYEQDATSARSLGFITATINDNNQGYVTTNGLLRNVNTNSYIAGTQLYLYTGGTVTNVRPVAPKHEVRLGYVVTQDSTAGVIYVYIQNGYEFTELHDVQISGQTNNDIPYWNSALGVWKNTNSPVFTSLTATTISASTFQNLPVSAVTSGTGISTSTVDGVVTVTNTDLGSSQNIFKNIQIDGVTQFAANSNSSNLNFSGINITIISAATNTLVFSAGTGGVSGNFLPTSGGTITGNLIVTGNTNVSGTTTTTGNVISLQNLQSLYSVGDEGGEITLAKPATNSTLSGTSVTIDIYQNRIRFFESGGSNRGAYIDLTQGSSSAGSNLLSGVTSVTAGSGLSGNSTTGTITLINTQVQGITGITAGSGISANTINNVTTIVQVFNYGKSYTTGNNLNFI